MPVRYRSMRKPPKSWVGEEDYEADRPLLSNISVYEMEPGSRETGLLDQTGTMIYAFDFPNPIGFVIFPEGD